MLTDHFFQKRVQPPQDPFYTYGRTYRLMVITLSVWSTALRATTRLKTYTLAPAVFPILRIFKVFGGIFPLNFHNDLIAIETGKGFALKMRVCQMQEFVVFFSEPFPLRDQTAWTPGEQRLFGQEPRACRGPDFLHAAHLCSFMNPVRHAVASSSLSCKQLPPTSHTFSQLENFAGTSVSNCHASEVCQLQQQNFQRKHCVLVLCNLSADALPYLQPATQSLVHLPKDAMPAATRWGGHSHYLLKFCCPMTVHFKAWLLWLWHVEGWRSFPCLRSVGSQTCPKQAVALYVSCFMFETKTLSV